MEAALVLLLVIASSSFTEVQAFPNGAPASACVNLTPDPATASHNGEPQTSPVPYNIDLAPLGAGYTPGQIYTCKVVMWMALPSDSAQCVILSTY